MGLFSSLFGGKKVKIPKPIGELQEPKNQFNSSQNNSLNDIPEIPNLPTESNNLENSTAGNLEFPTLPNSIPDANSPEGQELLQKEIPDEIPPLDVSNSNNNEYENKIENTAQYENENNQAVKKFESSIHKPSLRITPHSPIFLKIKDYKTLLETVNEVYTQANDAINTHKRITSIKTYSDVEHKRWKSLLEDIEKRLIYLDKTIFEK